MRRTATLALLSVALLFQWGCAARQVMKEADYGIVAIPHNTNMWPVRYREKAEKIMAEHFPAGYEIVREEEVVVGQTTRYDEDEETADVELIEGVLSVGATERSGSATTTDVTEYRIHYVPKRYMAGAAPPVYSNPHRR